MDMDVDLDFDLDDLDFGDRVKDFLQNKLKEIKNSNALIEKKLNDRRKHLEEVTIKENLVSSCAVSFLWKKCFNKKYVICYKIENNSERSLENIKSILFWSSSNQLTYKTTIYTFTKCEPKSCLKVCKNITNDCIEDDHINSKGFIIFTIDVPNYTDGLQYVINGRILCKQNRKEMIVGLPETSICFEDLTNTKVCSINLLDGNIPNILIAIAACVRTDIVIIFSSDWISSLDNTLDVYCSLTTINVPISCKKYVIASKLSQTFDDSILIVHPLKSEEKIFHASVHTKSNEELLLFIHHLHYHIPGVVIIPHELFEHYELSHMRNENKSKVLDQLQESVNKELAMIEAFTGKKINKNIFKLRNKLSDLEKETDLLYLRILELNKINTN